MNTIKKLPLTMAVIAALCPISVLAQEFTQEQIDAIVAKAVDKALAERQAKMDAAVAKKADVVTEPQSAAQSPDMRFRLGLNLPATPDTARTSRPPIRNTWRWTVHTTARPPLVVWATKATAGNSSSPRPSRVKTAPSGTST